MSWKKPTKFGYPAGTAPSPEEVWRELKNPKEAIEKARQIIEEYKKGPWPSFVKEAEKSLYPLLVWATGIVIGRGPWDTGAAPVPGVFTGALGRVMHIALEKIIREGAPEEYKKWEEQGLTYAGKLYEVHLRILNPVAGFMPTTLLRTFCELTDRFGWKIFQLRGGTGAMPVIHTDYNKCEKLIFAIRMLTPADTGGSGDALRAVTACPGPYTCPYAVYDTIRFAEETYRRFAADWGTYPQFPYKIKFKFSGCPIDCVKGLVSHDYCVIGVWLGAPSIDIEEFRKMVKTGEVDPKELVEYCPTGALSWDATTMELKCDPRKCVQCMSCIIRANPAILPGKERGIRILIGGTIKSLTGPKMGYVLVPFVRVTPENEEKVINWFLDLVGKKLVARWADMAKVGERAGDFSVRITWAKYTREVAEIPYPDLVTKEVKPEEMKPENLYCYEAIPYMMIPRDQKWKYYEALKKAAEKW